MPWAATVRLTLEVPDPEAAVSTRAACDRIESLGGLVHQNRPEHEVGVADAYDLLRKAIRERLQVIGTYGGHRREFCPHAIGTSRGEMRCLGLQFGGGSSKGAMTATNAGWRCFRVRGLSGLSTRPGAWHTLPQTRPQTCIDAIDLEIDHSTRGPGPQSQPA